MKYVFAFEEGSKEQKFLLGGKGANLAEMTNPRLPVPPGFTITTDACKAYMAGDDTLPDGLMDEVAAALTALEQKMGKRLGDDVDPLLVSVRSGAPFSMPGMMDTVLNLGLNDDRRAAASPSRPATSASPSTRTAASCRCSARSCSTSRASASRRRSQSCVEQRGVTDDTELTADDLQGLVETFKEIVKAEAGIDFPHDPHEQLRYAIEAVFKSWNGQRARDYRKLEGIADDLGTAVNVQTMVFGNKGDDSGTGVAFTREPVDGREPPVRRLPDERAGRGRRGRHPHHRAARRDGATTSPSATGSCST